MEHLENVHNFGTTSVLLLIEKLTEQFIGVLCVQSYDVSSKVKVRELSLIIVTRKQ